jgi:hypothetical protein
MGTKRTSRHTQPMSAFGGKADIGRRPKVDKCPLLMLWTAPALRHRSAIDLVASKPERFKEVRQATTAAFEVEGIGEDRRGNADKVDPGIGRTRMGQRIFECVLSIGTRSAQSIMASGHIGRTTGHMTAPDQCCSNSESSCQGGAVHT